jgi:hypothetical protein
MIDLILSRETRNAKKRNGGVCGSLNRDKQTCSEKKLHPPETLGILEWFQLQIQPFHVDIGLRTPPHPPFKFSHPLNSS